MSFQIIENSLTTACKCHGVSGSCSIKTCWRALPDFSKIGDQLKDRYGMAIEVKRKRRKDAYSFKPINKNIDIVPADELVYIQKSPDYCSPDRKMGSIGTQGRYVIIYLTLFLPVPFADNICKHFGPKSDR